MKQKRSREDPDGRLGGDAEVVGFSHSGRPKKRTNNQVNVNTVVEAPSRADSTPLSSTPTELFQKDTNFAKLGLSRWLADTCEKMGMLHPTGIQVMCIPSILTGKNVAGNSKTGSGKTACYALPILNQLSKDPFGVFALVLTPVRELAFQVAENFRALGRGIGVEVVEVVGGREMQHQSRMIAERKHVIVATPGRLADLVRDNPGLIKAFRNLRFLVLDEADKLLTPTFEEPLSDIIPVMPKSRQTLLFSATITSSIERLRAKFSGGEGDKELVVLDANPGDDSLKQMTQEYVFVPQTIQVCYLHYLLRSHFLGMSCMVFCPTIDLCQLFTTMLELLELPVTGLHSLQTQRRRQVSLAKFRSGKCNILIATDVASRGLDIPKVAVVINVGLPLNTDDFVHRSGRTARAGRTGLVVSLITERDVQKVHAVEERLGRPLEKRPTVEQDALKLLSRTSKARQKAELLLSETGFEERVEEHREKKGATKKKTKRKKKADENEKPSVDDVNSLDLAVNDEGALRLAPVGTSKRVKKKRIATST